MVRKVRFNFWPDALSTLEFTSKTPNLLIINKYKTQIEHSLEAFACISNHHGCIKIYAFSHITFES